MVVYDKLLKTPLLHEHKAGDIVDGDSRWINASGDTMEGDLIFPVTGFIMTDANGTQWRVTIGTDGALITTQILTLLDYQFQDGAQYEFQDGDDYNFKD
jgi:hypothetical protein